jgi:hypothetical protein
MSDKLSIMVTERNNSATADITPDSDIILVVSVRMKRLKVYSLVLKSALRVFGAMLGSRFNEVQRLDNNELTEIDMSEDDAEAIEIILNVIYSCNDTVHNGLDVSQIL